MIVNTIIGIVVVVLLFLIWVWSDSVVPDEEFKFTVSTRVPEISEASINNESYLNLMFIVHNIEGKRGVNRDWSSLRVWMKHYDGITLAKDVPLNVHDQARYDTGANGTVEIQCWYEDVDDDNGKLDEWDRFFFFGIPSSLDGIFLMLITSTGEQCWDYYLEPSDM